MRSLAIFIVEKAFTGLCAARILQVAMSIIGQVVGLGEGQLYIGVMLFVIAVCIGSATLSQVENAALLPRSEFLYRSEFSR